jgi:hypothetical protein
MRKPLFLIGISLFSLVFGVICGVSEISIVSVLITAILGLAAACIGLFSKIQSDEDSSFSKSKVDYNGAGILLCFISISFFFGTYAGVAYRSNVTRRNIEKPVKDAVFNSGQPRPATAEEALKWIMIQDELESRGYSKHVAFVLYNIYGVPDSNRIRPISEEVLKLFCDPKAKEKQNIVSRLDLLISASDNNEKIKGFGEELAVISDKTSKR